MKIMKFLKRKSVLLALACAVALGGVITLCALLSGQGPESQIVSVGVQQLADDAYLGRAAMAGQSISFSPEWFDETLQGDRVTAITVTALPPVTDGILKLGHTEVVEGQCIPRETLSYIAFYPNDGVSKSSFSFVPSTQSGTAGYTLCCALSVRQTANCCPTGTKSVVAVSTHETLTACGTLVAEDPDGDALYFEVCDYPAHGTLTLDRASGAFTYLPAEGFVGEDCFTWRVQDVCGAFSETATVSVTVRELCTGYLFSDIDDSAVHTAALLSVEKGLLDGEKVGKHHYFHPEKGIERCAFVTILLAAAEIPHTDAESTGFADDAEIPRGMKGAIRYAKEQGWLGEAESFRPHDVITRAEAAQIAARVLGLDSPKYSETVSDFHEIPVNVADAVYAIFEGGYISTMADGKLAPAAALSRGDAAKFFARLLQNKQ